MSESNENIKEKNATLKKKFKKFLQLKEWKRVMLLGIQRFYFGTALWDGIILAFLHCGIRLTNCLLLSPLREYLRGKQKFYKTLVSLMETKASMALSCSSMVELVCLIKDIIFDGLLKRPSPSLCIYKGRYKRHGYISDTKKWNFS